ncbi:MAG: 2,4-dihydroxyhept-2-ene-1,7-dioic acid aldolase, partial [Gammaproteobacteria bacterium]|nr:2,4-dihydroxyhept-2-ene-1,7-dioic acid aldolase [Gammaproteobacteria bacterium]
MRPNHVLHAWRDDKPTVGCWLSMDSAFAAEAMAHSGFDWVCIDMQHGLLDYSDLRGMLQAISTTDTIPLVRVSWNQPGEIMKALDAGAYGIVVPLINNREEAERAVSACRYPPEGGRSFGPIRAAMYGGRGYAAEANNEIACMVMIETAEALDNLDEIMSTPGVDGIYIGPADLAFALGFKPGTDDPIHAETVTHILQTAKKHGIAAGIHTTGVEQTRLYIDQGFHMVTLGSDKQFMERLARTELKTVREGTGTAKAESG